MTSNKIVGFIKGKIFWAKIFGEPRLNHDGDGKEWTFEVEPDETGTAFLEKNGLGDRIKNKKAGRKPYIILKKKEKNKDGNRNEPIRVYTNEGLDWDPTKFIGNESDVVVKVDIRDYGKGKKKGIYPVAIRVENLIPYVSSEFSGYDGGSGGDAPIDKKAKELKEFQTDFDLDDEIPV